MESIPVIETPRLILRGWREADTEPWVQMNADARVTEFFVSTYSREQSERLAAENQKRLARDGYGWWVIEVKGGPSFAGVLPLQQVPFKALFTPAREIGWRLPFESWGNGYATEAATAVLGFGFDRLGSKEIVAMTASINARSRRVMERLGMTHDPADDFDHPRIEPGHRLRRHVLYRITKLRP
jgi:RimJ/RimL family protein N-acetyltransferase